MFLIDQQKLDHSTQNPKVFSRLDIEFHSAIHTIAGNSMCRNIIRDVRMFVDRIRNLSLNRPMELLQIIADHFAIATALQKATSTISATLKRAAFEEIMRFITAINRIT